MTDVKEKPFTPPQPMDLHLWFSHQTVPQGTLVIAEAGVNHNGSLEMAKELIHAAKGAGADVVKFQLFDPKVLTANAAPLAQYQRETTDGFTSQQEMLASLTLPPVSFLELRDEAERLGIGFLCTPFDPESAQFLVEQCHVPVLKLSSGELTNTPFLEELSRFNVPVILSTGMGTVEEIRQAILALHQWNPVPVSILHCVSAYPAPYEAVNLRAISTLQREFPEHVIGYSDHTLGIQASVAAVAIGAKVIEKHLTLDPNLPGPDHRASLDPEAFAQMVQSIREVEGMLGHGRKEPHPVELDCIQVARKSVVLTRALPAGHILTREDLTTKRPGSGLAPSTLTQWIGKPLRVPCSADHILQLSDLRLEV